MSNHEPLPLAAVALLKRDKIDVNDVDLENYTTVENLLADKAGRAQPAKMPHSRRLDSYDIDDILVGNIRPYLKKIWHSDHAGGTNGDVLVFQARKDVENPILPRYLYHILASDQYFQYLQDHRKEGKMPRGDRNQALNFEILLPAPQVQEQIVTILDTFTDLDASMNRELELRDGQLTHALDSVFGNSTAPRSALKQVGDFTKGKGITKAQLQDEGLPAFHYGQVHTSYGHSARSTINCIDPGLIKNPTLAHPGDVVLATTSEDDEAVGKAVAWLGNDDAVVGGDAYVYSHDLEPRYVSYFFASHDFQLQKATKVYGTKVRRINDKGLGSLMIPVPAPETQRQIADTLDMFAGYSANLGREIKLRHQQLEYYRDQLLTFPAAE